MPDFTSRWLFTAPINISGAGDNLVIASMAGRRFRVYKVWFVCAADVSFKFKRSSTDFHPAVPMKANGSFVLDVDEEPWFETEPGESVVINLSGAVQLSGMIYYNEAP